MKKLLLMITAVFIFCTSMSAQAITPSPASKTDSLSQLRQEYRESTTDMKAMVDSLKALRDSLRAKLLREQQVVKEQQSQVYIKKYGEENGRKVILGKVWTGMTEDMMKDSWGEPDSITVNNQKWGKYTQWYYGDITYFFKNSKLIDWDQEKAEQEGK